MQHLKNIKSGNPKTKEQYQLTKNFDVIWLWSEDGKNWYEEVNNFQDDTIKIVYDENNIIVGVLSTRDITHISLLFVDKNHHRRGIAREMLNVVLDDLKKREDVPCITVNSSPYAVDAYERLGFCEKGEQQEKDGIIFVPMIRDL